MRNRIIEEIYMKRIPERLAAKVPRFKCREDVEDYTQEMYLMLLETPEDKLISMQQKGELPNYFAKMCINQLCNTKSFLHRKLETYITKFNLEDYESYRQREADRSIEGE